MIRRALLALPALLWASAVQAAPSVGQPAPEFTLKDASGRTVQLSDYRGKYVVLEWTNPGCPYVRKHYNSGNMASCLLYTSPSPRDRTRSRMPSSA